jgi:hypothetical protein
MPAAPFFYVIEESGLLQSAIKEYQMPFAYGKKH